MGPAVNIGVHKFVAVSGCIQCLTIGFTLIQEVDRKVEEASIITQFHAIVPVEINGFAIERTIVYVLLVAFF